MTRFLSFFLIFFSTLCRVSGQGAIVATGHVSAEIIEMFSAVETSQMNFGRFAPGPNGGEIIISPESNISVLGSVYHGKGLHSAASFYIFGDSEASFTVTLPETPIFLKNISSSKTMEIKNWICNTNKGSRAGILEEGSQTVYVGATLKVGSLRDNPAGIYAGTYTITFEFN